MPWSNYWLSLKNINPPHQNKLLNRSPEKPYFNPWLSLIWLLLAAVAAGCSAFGPRPTFIPEDQIPTVIELTAQAMVDQGMVTPPPTSTLSPQQLTATAAPTATSTEPPEPSQTLTPTLDVVMGTPEPLSVPDPLPLAEIQIINPGRLSRVLSPFKLHVFLAPQETEIDDPLTYQLILYGDDGRVLLEEPLVVEAEDEDDPNPHQVREVAFNITGSAVSARLEIRSLDSYGRIKSLATTDLVLLSEGEQEIKAIQDLYNNLIIQQPIPSTLIQGDVLIIQGLTRFAPDDQLIVELFNREGGQVGSGVVAVAEEDIGFGYRPFEGEIPFQVGSSSWIRVQVIVRDGNFSDLQYLSSVEVLVSP